MISKHNLADAVLFTAAAAAIYYLTRSASTTQTDLLLLSIDQWKDEYAPEENRFEVAGIIKNAHERDFVELTISDETITTLPETLPDNLKVLNLPGCTSLKELPQKLPSSLEILNVFDCDKLKSIPTVGPYCVVVKPPSLTPNIFASTLAINAVHMSALLALAREGQIENGIEHIEKIKSIECPISLTSLTDSKVVLIANSMREPNAKVVCKLYELESITSLPEKEGAYLNPLTKEVLNSTSIIDINKQINTGNLRYNEKSNNLELIKCPDLGHENDSPPIYEITTLNTLSVANIGNIIPHLELNSTQKSSLPNLLLTAHNFTNFICKNRLV